MQYGKTEGKRKTITAALSNRGFTVQMIVDMWDSLWRDPVHHESDYVTVFPDYLVEIEFNKSFNAVPFGVNNLKIYRMVPRNTEWVMQDVLFSHPAENWITNTGFSIIIAPFEELEGIIMEYDFKE